MAEEKISLPVVVLRGRVAMPLVSTTFDAGRAITLSAIRQAMLKDKLFIAVTQRDENKEEVEGDDLYVYGTVFAVSRVTNLPSNRVRVTGKGVYRVKLLSLEKGEDCNYVTAIKAPTMEGEPELEEAYFRTARYSVIEIIENPSNRLISDEVANILRFTENKEAFIYNAASSIKLTVEKREQILAADKLSEKFDLLYRFLNDELEISRLEKKISATVKRNIEKGQKDFYLREQLKAIHSELGDDENEKAEL
ncbi:MAG: LON peptidase substrate-binding domain-containing protein, partial [Clostridia bacterium]|nr:LON peptidase substrate-binding domain-containing protein [Clostridia bacterium]